MAISYGTIGDSSSETELHSSTRKRAHTSNFVVYLTSLAALLNIVALGLYATYTAPASRSMRDSSSRIQVTLDEITWIASMGAIAAMIGAPVSGYLSQKFGRKNVLMYNSLPYLLSWLMVAYSPSLAWIYAGRLLTGFCCGIASVTVPTYITEISTPDNRGLLGSGFSLAFALGDLMSMSLGMVLTWEWLAMVGAIIVVASVILLFLMPESPQWLTAKGRNTDALRSLKYFRGDVEEAYQEHREIVEKSLELQSQHFEIKYFLNPSVYKPIFLSIALMLFQQFSGINALMAYAVDILSRSGGALDPSIASVIAAAVQVLSASVSGLLMDMAGRKILYILSGGFMSIGLFSLGAFEYSAGDSSGIAAKFGWLPLAGLAIFLIAFSFGYGPIPWLMAPEMSPVVARSTIVSIASVCNYLFMFVVTKTYEDLRSILNEYGVHWLYAVISLTGCWFCWYCLPETKGKHLHEIQEDFGKKQRLCDVTRRCQETT